MAERELRGIAIPRHDTAINWAKAINFVPKQGELIVYDADTLSEYPTTLTVGDTTYNVSDLGVDITPSTVARFKFGDGTKTVAHLPYVTTSGVNYTLATEDDVILILASLNEVQPLVQGNSILTANDGSLLAI